MSDVISFSNGLEKLPKAIWFPGTPKNQNIYRGTPSEMVAELVGPRNFSTVEKALRSLTKDLAKSKQVDIQLPWGQPEEVLAALFVHAILELGISKAAYQA